MNSLLDLRIDSHVHTSLCHHAVGEMEDYVRAAVRKGLRELYFLEHLEAGINYFECTWLDDQDFDRYFAEGKRLQDKYREELFVGLGVEVGYNPARRQAILDKLAGHQWDLVGISYHFMEVDGRHYNLVSRKAYNIDALDKKGVRQVLTAYFETMLEAVEVIPGDFVCHLDAVLRYHPQIRFDKDHRRQIRRILEAMAAKEMALEVNVSGCRMRGEQFPATWIIREALNRNIRLFASSDAHRPEDVGSFDMLSGLIAELAEQTL